MTERRWYCVNKIGMATLCLNEKDADKTAARCDTYYMQYAPHRAVQLIDVAEVAGLRAENERLRGWLEGDATCPCCEGTRYCKPGCTFATDDPSAAEYMDDVRKVLWP